MSREGASGAERRLNISRETWLMIMEGLWKTQGEQEATIEAVLTVLEAREIAVPDHIRARIVGCDRLIDLDGMVRRAVLVDHAAQLFDD